VIPIAVHFRTADDAAAFADWTSHLGSCVLAERTGIRPYRPWTLAICIPIQDHLADLPRAVLEAITRSASIFDGEAEETRLDDSSSSLKALTSVMPAKVWDRFARENPHLRIKLNNAKDTDHPALF